MIISKVKGGLGNQLFIYFTSYILSKKKSTNLFFDVTDYIFDRSDRFFHLDKFRIDCKLANKNMLQKFRYIPKTKLEYKILKFFNINLFKKDNVFNENSFSVNDLLKLDNKKDLYIDGYWQNFKFINSEININSINFELKEEYRNYNEVLFNNINKNNSVAIHIRKGDYINSSNSKIYKHINPDYYYRAIKMISKNISSPIFYIFTDDIKWVKENIYFENANYIADQNLDEVNEFELMKNCNNFIISNSTFSLWASRFCKNKNKIIISPKEWFLNNNEKKIEKLVDSEWIYIEN